LLHKGLHLRLYVGSSCCLGLHLCLCLRLCLQQRSSDHILQLPLAVQLLQLTA
jgi:hypothetical protein